MSKTIVSIVSAQPTPNYLLIRELFIPGDKLMFITSTKMPEIIDFITDTLRWDTVTIEKVILKEGGEERWDEMSSTIESHLNKDESYCVNLTGGTKYMALAVQSVFEKYNAEFYYIPFPKNVMLTAKREIPIETRVTVEEYLSLHGHKTRSGNTIRSSQDATNSLFRFVHSLTGDDFDALDKLRDYRNNNVVISEIENKPDEERKPRISSLSQLLNHFGFIPSTDDNLSKYESQYITGGWFEEFVYYLIKDNLNPTDIKFGVKLNATNNDLDVVFTKDNRLFVIECKTGIDRQATLNQIAYKSASLNDYLKGLSAKSFIFALAKDDPQWTKISSNMGIIYLGRDYFTPEVKMEDIIAQIR